MIRTKKIIIKCLIGHSVFFAGTIVIIMVGEPFTDVSWRQMVAIASFPWIAGYAGYHIGWMNGHFAGWRKAQDETTSIQSLPKRKVEM